MTESAAPTKPDISKPDISKPDISKVVGLVLAARREDSQSDRALIAEVARAIRPETEHYAAPHLLPRLGPSSESLRAGVFRGAALIAQYPRIHNYDLPKDKPKDADQEPASEETSDQETAAEETSAQETSAQETFDQQTAAADAPVAAKKRQLRGGRLGLALKSLANASDNQDAEMRSIGAKVQLLPMLGREQAVKIIDGLLSRLDNTGISVDFYDLTRTLAYWETGQPDHDRSNRQRIVFDFFSQS